MGRVSDPFAHIIPARKPVPFEFVLDQLASLSPHTRPMFGCVAVYVGERIMFVLRDKPGDADNGVWLAYEPEHEPEIVRAFPRLQPIEVFTSNVRGWRKLSSRSPEFEDDVLEACARIRAGDPALGKVPGRKKSGRTPPRPPNAAPAAKATAPKLATKKIATKKRAAKKSLRRR